MRRVPVLTRRTIAWRVVVALIVTWLVPMILALWAPDTPGEIPFRRDLDAHVRVLLALPLLIAIEPFVVDKCAAMIQSFLRRGIIRPTDRYRYLRFVVRAARMRRSVWTNTPLLVIAVVLAIVQPLTHRDSAWGMWYGLVSLSLFRFVLLRWYYWLLIWYLVLWRISRLDLCLNPLHSDGAAGIGFLSGTLRAAAPMLVAQTIAVAGALAHRVQLGASPSAFGGDIAVVVVGMMAIALLPLTFFTGPLLRARDWGVGAYGQLSMTYVDAFRAKWITGTVGQADPLLGTPDIQSLADLHGSYDVVKSIRLIPVSFRTVFRLTALLLLPFAPLALMVIPLDQLALRILGQLF